MPSTDRRSVLGAMGLTFLSGIAGCSGEINSADGNNADPPAGSVEFVNNDVVPHQLKLEVTNVGATEGSNGDSVVGSPEVGVERPNLTTTTIVKPDVSQRYELVFRSPVWYKVRFTIDGTWPGDEFGTVTWNPTAPGHEQTAGWILVAKATASGTVSWGLKATDNLGPELG